MIVKSIISVFTAGVILFSSAFTPVAKAGLVEDLANSYTQSSFAKFVMNGSFVTVGTGIGAYYGSPQIGAMVGQAVALGFNDVVEWYAAGHTDDEVYDAFAQHADSLQTDFGTTTLINGGVRAYLGLASSWNTITRCDDNGTVFTSNAIYYSLIGTSETSNCNVTIKTRHTSVPFACHVTTGVEVAGTYNDIVITGETYSNALMSAGSTVYLVPPNSVSGWGLVKLIVPGGVVSNGVIRAYADLIPVSGTLPTSQDITVNSRPASITGNYGVDVDGTIVRVEGDMIVDESTNTVYNPVTNTTNNFTDYAFDYSDRSYTLTLEDGTLLRVVYGDDNITIEEGDTIYNIYYLIPNIPDGDDPGDVPGGDDGSGWAWLQGAWTQMMDKLSQIREAIVGLELSPEINVDVEVNEGEEVTQESWFADVLSKFSFLSSIRNIYSQLIADVTSDAATAAAVADGEIMLADVTTGHAATDGRASYTAPELAISFGSSDKYGVDWAGIRPLDLSWYAPYKETVDGILSGILWLSYLFLLIKRAPGIIRGSEMVTEDKIKIDAWRMRH